MFAAMRRASSRVRKCVAPVRLVLEIDIGERLAVVVADRILGLPAQ
jgi:hypothetical protein